MFVKPESQQSIVNSAPKSIVAEVIRRKGREQLQFCQAFQETRDTQPRKQVCAGASPTCDPFVPCLSPLGASATRFLHCLLCRHSPQPGFPGTSLPGSFSLPHTRTLSAVAAPLFTSIVSGPAPRQAQRSPAREGEAPSSGCPPAQGACFRS